MVENVLYWHLWFHVESLTFMSFSKRRTLWGTHNGSSMASLWKPPFGTKSVCLVHSKSPDSEVFLNTNKPHADVFSCRRGYTDCQNHHSAQVITVFVTSAPLTTCLPMRAGSQVNTPEPNCMLSGKSTVFTTIACGSLIAPSISLCVCPHVFIFLFFYPLTMTHEIIAALMQVTITIVLWVS